MFLSVSGLRKLNKCPHQWELAVITKAKGKAVNHRNFMCGSIIHKIIKAWFDADRPPVRAFFNIDIVKTEHDAFLRTNLVRWNSGETEASHLGDTMHKATKTAGVLVDIPFDSFGECRTEIYIKTKLDGSDYLQLGGVVDLWLVREREIYDFKISKDKKWFDMNQVMFYCFIVSLHTNRMHAKGGIIAPLVKNPMGGDLTKVFTVEDFRKLRQELRDVFHRIFGWLKERKKGGHFPTNKDDKNCWDCPYKNVGCVAWSLGSQHYGRWAGKTDSVGFFTGKN